MPLAVEPAPTDEELAVIVAVLEALAEPAERSLPAKPSRWRLAGRVYDDADCTP